MKFEFEVPREFVSRPYEEEHIVAVQIEGETLDLYFVDATTLEGNAVLAPMLDDFALGPSAGALAAPPVAPFASRIPWHRNPAVRIFAFWTGLMAAAIVESHILKAQGNNAPRYLLVQTFAATALLAAIPPALRIRRILRDAKQAGPGVDLPRSLSQADQRDARPRLLQGSQPEPESELPRRAQPR